MSANLAQRLKEEAGLDIADVAWTLQQGRRRFMHRKAVVARDRTAAIAALSGQAPERVQEGQLQAAQRPGVHFMFPGQGAQYVGMGAELYAGEPAFRQVFDHCADVVEALTGVDLRAFMVPAANASKELRDRLRDTAIAQPAMFAIEYALAQLWMSWGIQPKAMIGHSIGEFVAATVAGVFALDDVLGLVATRGRLMQQLAEGGMLSVRLPEDDVRARLPAELSIAAVNAPTVTVVAGPIPELEAFEARLAAEQDRDSAPGHLARIPFRHDGSRRAGISRGRRGRQPQPPANPHSLNPHRNLADRHRSHGCRLLGPASTQTRALLHRHCTLARRRRRRTSRGRTGQRAQFARADAQGRGRPGDRL